MRELDRERVLRVRVFAAAAFENELDLDRVAFPLLEVNDWRARPEIVARVLSRDRINGVRPKFAAPRCFSNRFANLLAHPDLIRAERRFDLAGRHPGVLADRAFAIRGKIDVLRDDGQRLRRPRVGRLGVKRRLHRGADVGRQIGRRADDELKHAVEK